MFELSDSRGNMLIIIPHSYERTDLHIYYYFTSRSRHYPLPSDLKDEAHEDDDRCRA